jgi:hypothetical protein
MRLLFICQIRHDLCVSGMFQMAPLFVASVRDAGFVLAPLCIKLRFGPYILPHHPARRSPSYSTFSTELFRRLWLLSSFFQRFCCIICVCVTINLPPSTMPDRLDVMKSFTSRNLPLTSSSCKGKRALHTLHLLASPCISLHLLAHPVPCPMILEDTMTK